MLFLLLLIAMAVTPLNASSAAWNSAQFGPLNNVWSQPVNFSASNIQFVNNPLDSNEFFVQLTASWQGNNALQQFFLPLAYTNFSGAALPLSKVSPLRIVEVFGQPASRIGAAASSVSGTDPRAMDLIGFATFPLAISNLQFAGATASPVGTTYTIDLVSSTSPGTGQAGHINGCFVNVSGTGSTSGNYYNIAQGSQAINQLISLFAYFVSGNSSTMPTNVECGSLLSAFDPASITQTQLMSITQAIPLTNNYYIVPVLQSNPSFASNANTVIGFARLRLNKVNITSGIVTSIAMDIGESVPVRNASSATGYSTVSSTTNALMGAPAAPFLPRQYDYASNGITIRPNGIVLAPALSPRIIKPS